jgi:hypothetical protein
MCPAYRFPNSGYIAIAMSNMPQPHKIQGLSSIGYQTQKLLCWIFAHYSIVSHPLFRLNSLIFAENHPTAWNVKFLLNNFLIWKRRSVEDIFRE